MPFPNHCSSNLIQKSLLLWNLHHSDLPDSIPPCCYYFHICLSVSTCSQSYSPTQVLPSSMEILTSVVFLFSKDPFNQVHFNYPLLLAIIWIQNCFISAMVNFTILVLDHNLLPSYSPLESKLLLYLLFDLKMISSHPLFPLKFISSPYILSLLG